MVCLLAFLDGVFIAPASLILILLFFLYVVLVVNDACAGCDSREERMGWG
jgi:hypothetical protein